MAFIFCAKQVYGGGAGRRQDEVLQQMLQNCWLINLYPACLLHQHQHQHQDQQQPELLAHPFYFNISSGSFLMQEMYINTNLLKMVDWHERKFSSSSFWNLTRLTLMRSAVFIPTNLVCPFKYKGASVVKFWRGAWPSKRVTCNKNGKKTDKAMKISYWSMEM